MADFLHDRNDFGDLLGLAGDSRKITPALIEKDYWIMHCLWSLQKQEFTFELKGGTSLSKGYGIIERFSEDIDIRFEPPVGMDVKIGANQNKPAHIESRQAFYDWLVKRIEIPGIVEVIRDRAYDDDRGRNCGIRLGYPSKTAELRGLKNGILLEVGFDDTTPNTAVTISSWAFDTAFEANVPIADNRAAGILCYNPEYTFVEKLQTISTKFRQWSESGKFTKNFLRHYYDVYCLLGCQEVLDFIGTEAYEQRKRERFRQADELKISKNEAFSLDLKGEFEKFNQQYKETSALYYAGQPEFLEILERIKLHINKL